MSFEYLELSVQNCPICDNRDFSDLNNNDRYFMGLHTVGCKQCGLIQTNPRPSKIGLDIFYKNDYRRFYQGITEPNQEYIKQHNKHLRLKYTVSFFKTLTEFKPNSHVLDIGCSEGALFSALRDDGFLGELYGVELNQDFARYAEANTNAKVYPTLEALHKPCDLVIVNHVFEHLLEPRAFLADIRRFVKDDGVLYIDVPDTDEYQSLGDLHIAHIFHYTSRTLPYLIELCGFKVISCDKHQPPFHPKSIRLVAKKSDFITSDFGASNSMSEASAWQKVRKISPVLQRARNFLASLPFAREIYGLLRK